MNRFTCPGCKAVLETADAQVETVFTCSKCSRKLKIPATAPAKAASVDSFLPTPVSSDHSASQPGHSKVSSAGPAPRSETQSNLIAATTPSLPHNKPTQSNPEKRLAKADLDISRVPMWKKPLIEVKEIVLATWWQTIRFFRFAHEKWHQRSLTKVVLHARLALGHRLVEHKYGDEQSRNQIAVLDEKIRILQEGNGSTFVPKEERNRLIKALADKALASPTAPSGVEKDYQKAKDSQARLCEQQGKTAQAGTPLFPKDPRGWTRVVVGYSTFACLVPMVIMSVVGLAHSGRNVGQPDPSSEAMLPEKGSLKGTQPSGTSVVFSEGVGTSKNEALRDAFRNAVQRVVGVFVDSETLVQNDAIISDKVLTFSDGAIKKYEELESNENKGLFRVKIKAAVEGRKVAARLEAAHISIKAVDLKNVAETFSKEIHADLEKLANEITEKEAKENARKILEKELTRIAKTNMIEAKVVGEIERGTKIGNKLPVKIKVRFGVNEAAFHEAMYKLEKSLLMNSSSWGKITLLATPDLIMKRVNQNSISEEIGRDNVFVLVNTGMADEKWRSHWHYYVLPENVGKLLNEKLVTKNSPKVKLSLLDKDGQVVAVDEFTADSFVRAFRFHKGRFSPYGTPPLSNFCYLAAPFFFNLSSDIRYVMGYEEVRDIPLTVEEIKLVQSVKCELFQ